MNADMPFHAQRRPLRSRNPLLRAASAAPATLRFAPRADSAATDRDIFMGYQIFLGRDPENSFVIAAAKTGALRAFINGLLSAAEFRLGVAESLARRKAMPHDRHMGSPEEEHRAWINEMLALPAPLAGRITASTSWRDFWVTLAELPGMKLEKAAAPNEAAIEPEAATGGLVMITIDQPKPGTVVHPGALVSGSGWVIAPDDVIDVAVRLDDQLLTHARHGLPRPDVARNFPHYRHVDHCGFAFAAEIPYDIEITASTQLNIVVRTVAGQTGRRGIRLAPPPSVVPLLPALPPVRIFVEDVSVKKDGQLQVNGWALSMAGIGRVAVYLGDIELGEAATGIARPDIGEVHTEYPNAGQCGFVFSASLRGYPAGPAAIRVHVTDIEGEHRQSIVPVKLPQTEPLPEIPAAPPDWREPQAPNSAQGSAPGRAPVPYAPRPYAPRPYAPPPYEMDEHATAPENVPENDRLATDAAPADTANIRMHCDHALVEPEGRITVSGWALAEGGVAAIEILDGETLLGQTSIGGARPDVGRVFPDNPDAGRAGFSVSVTPETTALPPGHGITLRVVAQAGGFADMEVALVATTTAAAAVPGRQMRLEIDRPTLADGHATTPVRGALTISGWSVAPEGIGSIVMYCDGQKLGDAYLGMRREDIAAAFPDCANSLLGGFAMVLPHGSLIEGDHAIRVVALSTDGTEQSVDFGIHVEAADELLPGSAPRPKMPRAEAAFYESILSGRDCHPHFALSILPGTAADGLAATLASLHAQAYGRFAAVIYTDSAADAEAAGTLLTQKFPALIGRATIGAGKMPKDAPGQPVLLSILHAGDVLGVDALLELALAHVIQPDAGFVYADDVRFDAANKRRAPFHKPDWSPELLLGMDYVGRPWCAPAAMLIKAGLSPAELVKLPAYDAALRISEATTGRPVVHINKVLASLGEARADPLAAVRAAANRRGITGNVAAGGTDGIWRLKRLVAKPGLVSIIIPTAGAGGLVRTAIRSIRDTTTKGAVEIVVLDNAPKSDQRVKTWLKRHADRVVDMPDAFNWSRFNNIGATAATGDFLLFLNDDIEARKQGWLEALLEHAQLPDVAVVGARLLYPDGKVQHAGQYLADTHARHFFRFAAGDDAGPFGLGMVAREMSAVTGACQLMRREVFETLGRFDEAHDVVNNDLDFCLRARAEGMRVVYTPHAELIHHELASRAKIEDSYDAARFSGAWRTTLLRGDPYHSRRLLADADHLAPDPEPVLPVHAGPHGPALDSIKNIAVVKLDHIGDYLTALPALALLKTSFPLARITLIAPPATAALARTAHVADEVIEFTFFHARSAEGLREVTAAEYEALAARLAEQKFDMAIDLRLHGETREVLRHTGAPFLVGFDRQGQFPWLDVTLEWEGDIALVAKTAHVADRYCMLVDAARAACRIVPGFTAAPEAAAASVPALARLPASFLERRLVCIHPGVGNPVRQWPAANYATLIDLLAEDGLNCIIIGGGDEQPVAREVIDRVRATENVVSLTGMLKLPELAGVMQACAIFVGNNSGPKHLAASLGVPTLGLHSSVVDAAEWAPIGGAAMALQRRVSCGPCYLEFQTDCPRSLACLTGIKPRDVMAACRRLLAMRPMPLSKGKAKKGK